MTSILLHSGRIVTTFGEEKADLFIENGVIKKLGVINESADEEIDVSGKLLFPGLIDCHVHFREPGLEHKATMKSEAAAAVAGGVTTVCEMPNTIPPVVTVAALADKVRRAHEIKNCDLRFFMGVTEPKHLLALRDVWIHSSAELSRLRQHCCGVKIYLDHSTGDQKIGGNVIDELFKLCGELNIPLVAHCEDAEVNSKGMARHAPTSDVSVHSQMRPPESEERAIEFAIRMARKYNAPLHVAHLSTKQGIELVGQAKADELRVTCEVAPHHLFLSTDDYEQLGTLGKMNPPLRSRDHVEALWQGIDDQTVDCISTDHAPHTLEEKKSSDPLKAPSGVPGVETMLPLLLTVALDGWPHAKVDPLIDEFHSSDIVRLCFENPNRIFSLGKKGIEEGSPTSIVIVDPNDDYEIRAKDLHSKCGWTPYEGWAVQGRVVRVV